MNKEDIERYIGKYVSIRLKSNSSVIWEGTIKCVREKGFDIIDKYDKPVTLDIDDVSSINEKQNRGGYH